MVLADKRYARADKRTKLPQWIQDEMKSSHFGLSTGEAVSVARTFLREMAPAINQLDLRKKRLTAEALRGR